MFEPITLDGGPNVSETVQKVLAAGVRAADPRRAVAAVVGCDGRTITLGGHDIPLPAGPVRVLALGKASAGMCAGLAEALGDTPITGVAATPGAGPVPPGITAVRGGHPLLDQGSLVGGERLMAAAADAGEGDLVIVLVSGGGSACAEMPVPGVDLTDLVALNRLLLASGAPIGEINTVRRSVSLLKGGGLAAAASPATVATIVISDVVGNDLPAIAGGPTVSTEDGPTDALEILAGYGLLDEVPAAVTSHLEPGPERGLQDDPGALVIAADGASAARGAAEAARRLGIDAVVAGTEVTGEAREVGRRLARRLRSAREAGMEIWAGETTVTLEGRGRGGRNQEVALAAAIELEGTERAVAASLGTDGVDGPTDAAGGVADGTTVARGRDQGLDAAGALAAHDSSTYLEGVGGRLICGPTGTNVGDLMLTWDRGPAAP